MKNESNENRYILCLIYRVALNNDRSIHTLLLVRAYNQQLALNRIIDSHL